MKWLSKLFASNPKALKGLSNKLELRVATLEDFERVRRKLGLPLNHNPSVEQLARFGLKLWPRPKAPAAPPPPQRLSLPDALGIWPGNDEFERDRLPLMPQIPEVDLKPMEDELRFLKLENTDLTEKLADAQAQLRMAKGSQRSLSLNAAALQKDWPDMHKRYFTKAGEADRDAGLPTKAKRKPKRK
jgi:hypothetical protein